MKILALDPATQSGYATEKSSGSINLGTERPQKLKALYKFIYDIVKKEKITHIVYEKPGGSHYNALVSHASLEGVILLQCELLGLEYLPYSATAIKKFVTDSGAASKQDVIDAVKERGYNPIDDNEADAIALYLLAKHNLT